MPVSPANEHECRHFDGTAEYTAVYAGKGCGSKANRECLNNKKLSDGIIRKARRGRPLTDEGKQRNRYLSETRYAAEQGFGTLHRKFRCHRATYFGLRKANAQSHLKAVFEFARSGKQTQPRCACCRKGSTRESRRLGGWVRGNLGGIYVFGGK
nr:transposase [Neisseria yangbaofengii]